MNEIHMKFKPFVIGLIVVFLVICYLALRSPDCSNASNAVNVDSYQQQVPPKKQSLINSQPFTVYAITPTYARYSVIRQLAIDFGFFSLKVFEYLNKILMDSFVFLYLCKTGTKSRAHTVC